MPREYDVIVVGAGPAGCMAAYTAARLGASVLLLEEHPEVGLPLACAEGLSRSMVTDYLEIKPEWISTELDGVIISRPDGQWFRLEYPEVGWIMNRKIFDSELAKMAVSEGVVLKTASRAVGIENNEVIVRSSDNQLRYRYKFLIAADGIASNVGRWLGIDTKLSLNEIETCAQYIIEDIETDPRYVKLIFGEEYAPGGYGWVFPKSGNCANIGVATSPLKTRRHPKLFLDKWVSREFPDGRIRDKIYACVPAKILRRFWGRNFFLIGDAARLTDPLSGGGIANAVKSGVIAGRNAIIRLKGGTDHFYSEIKREILNEIEFHYRIRNVYIKLTERDLDEVFKISRRIFEGQTVKDINMHRLVKELLLSSPRLFRLGFRLFF